MKLRSENLIHSFYFPEQTGKITFELFRNNFNDLSDKKIKEIFTLFRDMLYGLLIEEEERQEKILNEIKKLSKKLKIKINDKDEADLIQLSKKYLYAADYLNALNMYKVAMMSYLNSKGVTTIIDLLRKIDKKNENDIIKTLAYINSVCFLNALVNKDSEEIIKILNQTLEYIDTNFGNLEKKKKKNLYFLLLGLKTTMYQSLGTIYLKQNKLDEALECLLRSENYNQELEENEIVNSLEFRNVRFRIGEVYLKKAEILFHRKDIEKNINQIKELLNKAIKYFEKVDIINKPYLSKKELNYLYLTLILEGATNGILRAKCMLNILNSEIE